MSWYILVDHAIPKMFPRTHLSEWGSHGVDRALGLGGDPIAEPRSQLLSLCCGLGEGHLRHSHTK